jgi:transcriptional regulator
MYVPPHFAAPDTEALHGLIEDNPFGILVRGGESGLDADHIPFLLDRDQSAFGRLHCHVARANPIWKTLGTGDTVLVIFGGGEAYISPNWYPSKQDFHKQVPTWNYRVAHAHGRVTVRDDADYVRGVVSRLTQRHESGLPTPWQITDSPKEFIDAMLKAIVGIEIEITRLTGKFKLSQNKEARDIRNAGTMLRSRGETALGEAMLAAADAKERG